MAQKRIRELDTYTQLASGEVGYVDPDTVFFPVDSTNFSGDPYKVAFSDLFASVHVEADIMESLASRTVSVTFETAFTSRPLIRTFRVYRVAETYTGSGVYRMKDVLYSHAAAWLTTTGFDIDIDTSEDLSGIIIEFEFREV